MLQEEGWAHRDLGPWSKPRASFVWCSPESSDWLASPSWLWLKNQAGSQRSLSSDSCKQGTVPKASSQPQVCRRQTCIQLSLTPSWLDVIYGLGHSYHNCTVFGEQVTPLPTITRNLHKDWKAWLGWSGEAVGSSILARLSRLISVFIPYHLLSENSVFLIQVCPSPTYSASWVISSNHSYL